MKGNEEMPAGFTDAMEERVRDAFGAAAETITALDLPPRPDPARRSGGARIRRARVLPVWALGLRGRALVPAAAAAAVTAITVTAAVVIPGLVSGSPGGAQALAPGEALAGVPPFFAGIVSQPASGPVTSSFTDVVKIFSSATGAPAGTVRARGSQTFSALSRLGDDQSFVAAADDRKACMSRLWKFTIDAAGRPSALTRLAAPVRGQIDEVTSSADGTTLALKVSGCAPGGLQTAVIDVATGQITSWDTPADTYDASLSLTADGSVLGFILNPDVNDPHATDQAWTKPTDAPAGSLLSHARQVPGLGANADRTVLSPDGTQLFIEDQKAPTSRAPVTLSLITTGTGALVKKILQLSSGKDLTFVGLALDHAGQHMLAYGGHPGSGRADAQEIDLRSGQTRTLPITNPVIEGGLTTFAW